jgi:DNA-binding PadR family transcriptional regulator
MSKETRMKFLSRLEEIYLIAIWKLGDGAYGVQIRKKIEELTGKKISYGALYFTLEQLFKKGYVERTPGEPTPVRGGCSKIFYTVSKAGKEQLNKAIELQESLWSDLSASEFK